ncbi:hypothetical protein DW886_25020 [Enterocloster aldenensis]|uniref:hypothetical protein n=1 Tax=Enterocloster aldenensis TaxID=358742 RepID=UPI000E4861CB|nr:hypothetical protein DW886_25020 [Enterocloster aldenensis]
MYISEILINGYKNCQEQSIISLNKGLNILVGENASGKKDINSAIEESMGNVFGQSVNLQFSENSFSAILQSIKMVFFPNIGEMNDDKFRDVAINSLGYNNLLYIATVFSDFKQKC